MRKYISPRIEEIKIKSDVITGSVGGMEDGAPLGNKEGWAPGGYEGGFAPTRRNRYDAEYDLY